MFLFHDVPVADNMVMYRVMLLAVIWNTTTDGIFFDTFGEVSKEVSKTSAYNGSVTNFYKVMVTCTDYTKFDK